MPNKLRELREAAGFNQREISEKSHTPQSLISDLELGKRKPWPKAANRLARALKTTAEDIFPEDFKGVK